MEPDLQRGRCSTCGETITGLMRLMTLPAATVARYRDAPPDAIPDDVVDVTWSVDPCGHFMGLMELREAGIEVDRYEHPQP